MGGLQPVRRREPYSGYPFPSAASSGTRGRSVVERSFESNRLDVDATLSLLQHAELVGPGHSEYWSGRMLRGAMAARNTGVNGVWLGSNQAYCQMGVTRDRSSVVRLR